MSSLKLAEEGGGGALGVEAAVASLSCSDGRFQPRPPPPPFPPHPPIRFLSHQFRVWALTPRPHGFRPRWTSTSSHTRWCFPFVEIHFHQGPEAPLGLGSSCLIQPLHLKVLGEQENGGNLQARTLAPASGSGAAEERGAGLKGRSRRFSKGSWIPGWFSRPWKGPDTVSVCALRWCPSRGVAPSLVFFFQPKRPRNRILF